MIWILYRKTLPDYDEAKAFVVRASDEIRARHQASRKAGSEGKQTWLDPTISVCEAVSSEGKDSVVLRSFFNG